MSDTAYTSSEARIVQLVRDDARLAERVLRLLMGEPCTDAVVSPVRSHRIQPLPRPSIPPGGPASR